MRPHLSLPWIGAKVSEGGGFHKQVGGGDGEDAVGISDQNRAGDYPDLAAGIKAKGDPDSCVGDQRCPDLISRGLRLNF